MSSSWRASRGTGGGAARTASAGPSRAGCLAGRAQPAQPPLMWAGAPRGCGPQLLGPGLSGLVCQRGSMWGPGGRQRGEDTPSLPGTADPVLGDRVAAAAGLLRAGPLFGQIKRWRLLRSPRSAPPPSALRVPAERPGALCPFGGRRPLLSYRPVAPAPRGRPGGLQAGRGPGGRTGTRGACFCRVRGCAAAARRRERSPGARLWGARRVVPVQGPPGLPTFPMPRAPRRRRVSPLPPRTGQWGLRGQPQRTRGPLQGGGPSSGPSGPGFGRRGVGGAAHRQAPGVQLSVMSGAAWGRGREEARQAGAGGGGCSGPGTAPGPDSFRPRRGARGPGLKFSSEAPARRWGAAPPASWARPHK